MAECDAIGKALGGLIGDGGQETIKLRLDHLVALTAPRFRARAVDNGDPAALVSNQPGVLQLMCGS